LRCLMDKMLWQDPRPYFMIKMAPLNCKDIEYGNPSGHAVATAAIYLTVFYLLKGRARCTNFLNCLCTVPV
jgi:hypothetical protein